METFLNYTIYRVVADSVDLLIDLDNCNCQIGILYSSEDFKYTDSDSLVLLEPDSDKQSFYYRVQVSVENYTRNSFIQYSGFPQLDQITLIENNVSTNKDEYIKILWESISDSSYFYQYEIWRSPDEEFSDTSIVVIIPNYKIDHFLDRTTGYGTSLYYSVATVDINGRKIFSDFIRGWKNP